MAKSEHCAWQDTAWEDLGPWRAPETEPQQEDPGSGLNFTSETDAWGHLKDSFTSCIDVVWGPADTTVTDGPKETTETTETAVSSSLGCGLKRYGQVAKWCANPDT